MERPLNEWIDLILRFHYGMSSLKEVDEWIYQSGDAEEFFGIDGYFDYDDYEFSKKYNRDHSKHMGQMLYDALKRICTDDYRKIEVKWIVNKILTINEQNHEFHFYGCGKLATLKEQGYEFIPQVFVDYVNDISQFADERYLEQVNEEYKKIIENL